MVYGRFKMPYQALKQAKMAFELHRNFVTLYYLLKTRLKILIRYKFNK
jgi:hypothetical protein